MLWNLSECAANCREIVTGHDVRDRPQILNINGISMVTDMVHIGPLNRRSEDKREHPKLVDVAQPLADALS